MKVEKEKKKKRRRGGYGFVALPDLMRFGCCCSHCFLFLLEGAGISRVWCCLVPPMLLFGDALLLIVLAGTFHTPLESLWTWLWLKRHCCGLDDTKARVCGKPVLPHRYCSCKAMEDLTQQNIFLSFQAPSSIAADAAADTDYDVGFVLVVDFDSASTASLYVC